MMDENKKDLPISPITEDVIAAMRRASAMTLPDNPSAARMKPGEIRRRFWAPIFAERGSLFSELVRVIGEINDYLVDLPTESGASEEEIERLVQVHDASDAAHGDIRRLIEGLSARLNAIANSDDATLDDFKEIVAYIKENKELIDAITTSKVSVVDIVNNLSTNASNKPLSAAQGMALKALIDAIKVPTKLSDMTEDAGHRTVSDTEKTAWGAKLGASDLQAATDAALAQAKASGAFDGAPGKDGKTPVRGTDYWTAADKAEMVSSVIAELPVYDGEAVTV